MLGTIVAESGRREVWIGSNFILYIMSLVLSYICIMILRARIVTCVSSFLSPSSAWKSVYPYHNGVSSIFDFCTHHQKKFSHTQKTKHDARNHGRGRFLPPPDDHLPPSPRPPCYIHSEVIIPTIIVYDTFVC